MKVLILFIGFLAFASAILKTPQLTLAAFRSFTSKYGKTYAAEEYNYRLQIFSSNLALAQSYQTAEVGTARYGVTQFMDLTPEEFRANYLMPKEIFQNFKVDPALVQPAPPSVSAPPASFDWRDKNAVTAVYDQGQCGSCWAFSASETIESFHFLATQKMVQLSQQQIVDCDTTSYGCNGGWTEHAFKYVMKAGGQDTLASYRYTAVDGTCKFKTADIGAKISSWAYVTQNDDENAMLNTLYAKGPLSICVDASSWQFYNGGVVQSCGTQVDHCVQLTGYSTVSGINAWNVRNSWGTSWGEKGYIFLSRGHNTCAIASCVTYVVSA